MTNKKEDKSKTKKIAKNDKILPSDLQKQLKEQPKNKVAIDKKQIKEQIKNDFIDNFNRQKSDKKDSVVNLKHKIRTKHKSEKFAISPTELNFDKGDEHLIILPKEPAYIFDEQTIKFLAPNAKDDFETLRTETLNLRRNNKKTPKDLPLETLVLRQKLYKKFEKLEVIKKELEFRSKLPIYKYNSGEKVHKKQLLFHKSQKRNRWVFGGNRSGKSECGAVEVVWLARGIHPYKKNKDKTEGWVVSLSSRVQREVAQKKILNYLDPRWIDDIIMQTGKKNSAEFGIIESILVKNVSGKISTISFKSCEEGREKFQGSSLDYVWFDEEPPEEIYIECAMRVLDKKGDLFGTMTPLKGLTFVYDKIYLNPTSDPEIFTIFMDWNDNPYLPEEEIERLKSVLSAEELEARQYGKFVDKSNGLVYTEFNESVNVIEPFAVPKEWYSNISIDPGLKNPTSCHWYAVDGDGNIFVIYEHYESNQNIDYHSAKIKSICEILDWPVDSRGYYNAIIDTASTQHTLNNPKSVADLFYENKILVNPKVNKDLFAGISRVKSYFKNALGQSKLFIFSNCVNLIKEIKSYRWGKLDVPIKKDDHALDELRYFVMTRPEAYTAVEVKNEIQKDKENLFKKILSSRRRSGF